MSETALPFHNDTSLTISENSASMIVKVGHPFICATASNGVKPYATPLANHEATFKMLESSKQNMWSVQGVLIHTNHACKATHVPCLL